MKRFIFAILFIVLLISSGFGLSFSGFDSKDSDIVVSGDSFCYMVRDLGDGYSVLESFSYSVDDHFSGCNLSIHRGDDCWVLSSGDSIKCSNDVVERNFTLNGSKVWLFKIVLYEPAKLLNFLSVYYTLRTTRAIVAHNHAVNFFAILNESGKPIIILPLTLEIIGFYTDVHPLFYHVKDYTKDNLNMVFKKNGIIGIPCRMDFILPDFIFDKGVYYIVVGSQAYTLNSSDYDVFYNVSFVFPENYSMSIEVYRQADPIGVSFCEMNASYVYWDIHYDRFAHELYEKGKVVFIGGNMVFEPKHDILITSILTFPDLFLRYFSTFGWYYFSIGGDLYLGFGVHPIVIRLSPFYPIIKIYDDGKPLSAKLDYSVSNFVYDVAPPPVSIHAFDIDLK